MPLQSLHILIIVMHCCAKSLIESERSFLTFFDILCVVDKFAEKLRLLRVEQTMSCPKKKCYLRFISKVYAPTKLKNDQQVTQQGGVDGR